MSKMKFAHDSVFDEARARASFIREGSVVELTRDRACQPWRARHREILNRIVRETEPPTDSLPRMTKSGSTALDDAYYERVGEVLDLAGSIGAILMASGMSTTAATDQ